MLWLKILDFTFKSAVLVFQHHYFAVSELQLFLEVRTLFLPSAGGVEGSLHLVEFGESSGFCDSVGADGRSEEGSFAWSVRNLKKKIFLSDEATWNVGCSFLFFGDFILF